jgi:Spy/CpxP family protein refolding chaperone
MRFNARIITPLFAAVAVFGTAAPNQLSAFQDPQANTTESGAPDLITALKLTPEQRQKIRAVREQTKDERAAINQRLKESNRALEEALDADPLDENLIEQRMREVTIAQTAQMRMRIRTEVMIRRVLNRDQLATWRILRLRLQDVMGAQRANGDRPLRPAANSLRPNQRNGVDSLPPRNARPRNPRP